jgi:putative phage-type endonuclease
MAEGNDQRTDEWFIERMGKMTASRFSDVMAFNAPDKNGFCKPQEARAKYMRQLAFERLAEKPKQSVTSKSLAWGTDVEEFACNAYQLATGNIVTKSTFVVHPTFTFIGASPDGLVDLDGGCEIKCPWSEEVHIGTWLDGMPEEHRWQVQGNMFVTRRKWWDFISYDPRQKQRYQLYIERIERDDTFIKTLESGLLQFEVELKAMLKKLDLRAA